MPEISPKRILMLRSPLGVFGAERVILDLAQGLLNTEFEPVIGVIENRSGGQSELAQASRDLTLETEVFFCNSPFDWRTVFQIRKYIREHGIEIVHTHGYKANFYGLMATQFTSIPGMATCHPWTETDYSMKARLYTFLDKLWLKRMKRIIAISDDVKQQLRTGEGKSRIDVIPNGIDLSRFNGELQNSALHEQLGFESSNIIIGTVGRLVPEKGYSYLLQSAARICASHPQVRLIIVGDGPLRTHLTQQAASLDLGSKVSFLGIREDTPALLAMMDIFVMSSTSEGLPMALLEAMASGTPIVATRVGAIPHLIKHHDSGLLVPPENVQVLADAVEQLIRNRQKAQKMGERAREAVYLNYSSTQMTRRYIEHYEQLLQ